MNEDVQVTGAILPGFDEILTPAALDFVAGLHRRFNSIREMLLAARAERQKSFDAGGTLDFLPETAEVRNATWQVASTPDDLQKRRVEITGPAERKMMINAFNSGASAFMCDLEDALSPTWANVVQGQINLRDAVRKNITFENPDGRVYRLNNNVATLLVRPRGWHLTEKHVLVDGAPISASLFDFGLYFFHNATELIARGSGPYFYLPKMESHLEARLWNDVFVAAQEARSIPHGTIRATVLVETIPAAFEMDEILYELRDHSAGLNAGRWDYIFSMIKKFRTHSDMILPDRVQVTMTVPFMRAYTELLVKTCHRRNAHAIGGMAAFIPSRSNPEINQTALAKVREDKEREVKAGFDGTWAAHPDLVPTAMEAFDRTLGDAPNQKERQRDVQVAAHELLNTQIAGSSVSENGVRNNISVALQYINAWLQGNGAVGIYNLMEDAATAEISRAQLWQWLHNNVALADGHTLTADLYQNLRKEELEKLGGANMGHYGDAAALLDSLVLPDDFTEFLTLPAYAKLP